MGGIPEFSGGFPRCSAMLPRDAAPFPKILKENGYATAGIGKWDLTPEKEQGPGWPVEPLAQRLGLRLLLGLPGPEAGQYDTMISENQEVLDVMAACCGNDDATCSWRALSSPTSATRGGSRSSRCRSRSARYWG
jgi:hypothetical protein